MKKAMTPSETDPATIRLLPQCLKQLRYRILQLSDQGVDKRRTESRDPVADPNEDFVHLDTSEFQSDRRI
jgi:hypothetical protein